MGDEPPSCALMTDGGSSVVSSLQQDDPAARALLPPPLRSHSQPHRRLWIMKIDFFHLQKSTELRQQGAFH
ncbi:hypothetical protein NQZ68_031224 [Dissostichus eleginoides]|nr:hypothetical protein NQZ68_031224 [Dissostichus eleginoides]